MNRIVYTIMAVIAGLIAMLTLSACGQPVTSGLSQEAREAGITEADLAPVEQADPSDLFVLHISEEAPRLDPTDALIYGTIICADLAIDIASGNGDTLRAAFGAMELDGYTDEEQVSVAVVANVTLCPDLSIYDHPGM